MITKEDQLKCKSNFLTEEGSLGLVRCMACKRENYSLNVLSGICTWCGWNEEKKDE